MTHVARIQRHESDHHFKNVVIMTMMCRWRADGVPMAQQMSVSSMMNHKNFLASSKERL